MAELFAFNAARTKRIVNLVKKDERTSPAQMRQRSGRSVANERFWVELTEEHTSNAGTYKWQKVEIDNTGFVPVSPAVTSGSDYSAFEVNETAGLAGRRVEVRFYGYTTGGTPRYVFEGIGEPMGEFQEQVHKNVSQNQMGMGFIQSHALP